MTPDGRPLPNRVAPQPAGARPGPEPSLPAAHGPGPARPAAVPGGDSPAGGAAAPVDDLSDLIRVPSKERGAVVRLALSLAAAVCLVLGVVFWLLPVVTGIPFYLLGFVCLGMASPAAARLVNRHERRLPRRIRLLLRTGRGRAAGPAQG